MGSGPPPRAREGLVAAQRTAKSPELAEKLKEILRQGPEARFG